MSLHRINYKRGADGWTRRQGFTPGATGLDETIWVDATLTVLCRECGEQVAWVFNVPHPELGRRVDVIQLQLPDQDFRTVGDYEGGRVNDAMDTADTFLVSSMVKPQPTYCGGCRHRRTIHGGPLRAAIAKGKAKIRVGS